MTHSDRQHICIDFEGEGEKRSTGEVPAPHLLGALVPGESGRGERYRVYLLRRELAPIARAVRLVGSVSERQVCTLEEAVADLVAEAEARDCLLVSFSEHELRTVERVLGVDAPLVDRFRARWHNVKVDTDPLIRDRRDRSMARTLEATLEALRIYLGAAEKPGGDVAETLRRLTRAGVRSRRFRNWSASAMRSADQLLRYNRRDCEAVWRLVAQVQSSRPTSRLVRATGSVARDRSG